MRGVTKDGRSKMCECLRAKRFGPLTYLHFENVPDKNLYIDKIASNKKWDISNFNERVGGGIILGIFLRHSMALLIEN